MNLNNTSWESFKSGCINTRFLCTCDSTGHQDKSDLISKESSPESHDPFSCPFSTPPFFACFTPPSLALSFPLPHDRRGTLVCWKLLWLLSLFYTCIGEKGIPLLTIQAKHISQSLKSAWRLWPFNHQHLHGPQDVCK